jgi:hypothetical protein
MRWRNDPKMRDGILGYRFPVTEEMEADWVGSVLKDQSRTRCCAGNSKRGPRQYTPDGESK